MLARSRLIAASGRICTRGRLQLRFPLLQSTQSGQRDLQRLVLASGAHWGEDDEFHAEEVVAFGLVHQAVRAHGQQGHAEEGVAYQAR